MIAVLSGAGRTDADARFSRAVPALLFAGALLLLAIVLVALQFAALTQKNSQQALYAARVNNRVTLLLNLVQDAETGQRGYILTGQQKYLAPFKRSQVLIRMQFLELTGELLTVGVELVTINRLKTLIDAKIAEMVTTIDMMEDGRARDAVNIIRTDKGKLAMDEIRQIMALIGIRTDNFADDRNAALARASLWLMITISGGAVLLVALVGGAVFLVTAHARQLSAARTALVQQNETLEQRVLERTQYLQRANRELQNYSYIVGHDLRAPLVNIMGFTSELEHAAGRFKDYLDQPADTRDASFEKKVREAIDEDIPEALRFIRSSMKRMDELINEILKLARTGSRQLVAEPVDLSVSIRDAIASLQHRLDEGRATVDVAGEMPSAITDRLALQQIFGNLFDNAIKYADKARPLALAISGRVANGMVHIEVRDNGRGIAEQDYERVFELFRRSGPQDRAGEGIGLAHVRALARRLGGDVTVRSQLGEGTIFFVSFVADLQRLNDKGKT